MNITRITIGDNIILDINGKENIYKIENMVKLGDMNYMTSLSELGEGLIIPIHILIDGKLRYKTYSKELEDQRRIDKLVNKFNDRLNKGISNLFVDEDSVIVTIKGGLSTWKEARVMSDLIFEVPSISIESYDDLKITIAKSSLSNALKALNN